MTGETGAAGGPQTVITAVAVLGALPADGNVKVIVDGPGAADADARNENAAGANAGGARTAEVGVTVTPGGRPGRRHRHVRRRGAVPGDERRGDRRRRAARVQSDGRRRHDRSERRRQDVRDERRRRGRCRAGRSRAP